MKKSTFGLPIPILIIEMGVPLYRPVMVVKPRSECKVNLRGDGSRYVAIFSARDRAPTVTLDRSQVKLCARDNEY